MPCTGISQSFRENVRTPKNLQRSIVQRTFQVTNLVVDAYQFSYRFGRGCIGTLKTSLVILTLFKNQDCGGLLSRRVEGVAENARFPRTSINPP
jgi:hypothetical protein